MKTSKIKKEWMTHDMKRVIEQLTLGDYVRSETDLMRLQKIQKEGRPKDFASFYEIAGEMRADIDRQKREAKQQELKQNLVAIEQEEIQTRRNIKQANLGKEGLGKKREEIEAEYKARLDQREMEHRKKLTRLEDEHVTRMKALWTEGESELRLLEEQITLYGVRLEAEPVAAASSSPVEVSPNHPSSKKLDQNS